VDLSSLHDCPCRASTVGDSTDKDGYHYLVRANVSLVVTCSFNMDEESLDDSLSNPVVNSLTLAYFLLCRHMLRERDRTASEENAQATAYLI
jgi:hypothetical protein